MNEIVRTILRVRSKRDRLPFPPFSLDPVAMLYFVKSEILANMWRKYRRYWPLLWIDQEIRKFDSMFAKNLSFLSFEYFSELIRIIFLMVTEHAR